MADRDLFGRPASIGTAGDALQRHYTPLPLANQLVRHLLDEMEDGHLPRPHTIIEPSVGEGAFVRAVRGCLSEVAIIGVDIDPDAAGLALADVAYVYDWPAWARARAGYVGHPGVWVVGNPPFACQTDVQREQLVDHINAALDVAELVAFILPVGLLFPSVMAPIMQAEGWRRPMVVHAITPRPWEVVRDVGLFVWTRTSTETHTRIDHLPRWRS